MFCQLMRQRTSLLRLLLSLGPGAPLQAHGELLPQVLGLQLDLRAQVTAGPQVRGAVVVHGRQEVRMWAGQVQGAKKMAGR